MAILEQRVCFCYRSRKLASVFLFYRSSPMNSQRILRQQLEDLQRAGVSQVPAQLEELVAALAEYAPAKESEASQPSKSPAASAAVAKVTKPAAPVVSPPPEHSPKENPTVADSTASDTTTPRQSCASLSHEERETNLASLAERVAACQKCQELADTRTQTVFGVGNPEAKILFIGEAPGADEDKQGEPFVGRAGKLLNDIIAAMKLTREEIYICNILRCRPPGNRNPSSTEAANCREFLDGQIETVAPEYIVCWGSIAAKNLLDTDTAIGRMRGTFYEYGKAKVLCTYHPSYLLRNPAAKKEVWKDMKFLMKDMGVEL